MPNTLDGLSADPPSMDSLQRLQREIASGAVNRHRRNCKRNVLCNRPDRFGLAKHRTIERERAAPAALACVAARQFGDVTLTPTTFLIDKEGRILKTYVGEPDFAAVHKLIEKELAG